MKKLTTAIKRREFLKQAGLSSMALAAIPALDLALPATPGTPGHTSYDFVCVNSAGVIDGIHHFVAMSGQGSFTPGGVTGGGVITHVNNDPALPTPKPILGTGTWKAKRRVSFEEIGTYGVNVSGIGVMEINIVPNDGPVTPAQLEIVCNLGFAGLLTGRPEGYVLTVAGLVFEPVGLGLTLFYRAVTQRD